MGVPMIRDPSTLAIDVVTLVSIPCGGDPLQVREESGFRVRVWEPVCAPDDHRGHADHAVAHPALVVLEEPVGQALGVAQQAGLHTPSIRRTQLHACR